MARRRRTDVTVQRVHRGDVYARVSTVGTDGERPFLLVPGIGVSANYFERLAPELNEFGPVHALDLPGFGGVPHPKGGRMRIRDYADLVGKVIDDLRLNDPVIVGHSMGTQIVADLASRRPDISTVVLIDPVVNRRERTVLRAALRFAESSMHETWQVAVLASGAYLLCGFRWFSRVLPEMMQYRIEDTVHGIRASTLVIRGEFDSLCPPEWVDELTDALPRSRAWEIPGAAHSVMHANAEEVARLCVDHARRPALPLGEVELREFEEDTVLPSERGAGGGAAAGAGSDDADDAAAPDADATGSADSAADAEAADHSSSDEPGPDDVVKAIGGRVQELVGIIKDDDTIIAAGKTAHAEAMESEMRETEPGPRAKPTPRAKPSNSKPRSPKPR